MYTSIGVARLLVYIDRIKQVFIYTPGLFQLIYKYNYIYRNHKTNDDIDLPIHSYISYYSNYG